MIRISGIEKESITDGTGMRYTIFTQGCLHDCAGCHNPDTHALEGGREISIDELIEDIKNNDIIDGVTLSGGDPLFQSAKSLELILRIKKETNLNIWVYTGFMYEKLTKIETFRNILKNIDVLVDGKFELDKRSLEAKFRGSTNQRVIDVQKTIVQDKIVLYEREEV